MRQMKGAVRVQKSDFHSNRFARPSSGKGQHSQDCVFPTGRSYTGELGVER